ncbi:MAG: hypothetical protein M1821_001845, partial [Bathelium mastoideum]
MNMFRSDVAKALDDFHSSLSADQAAQLDKSSRNVPTADDVVHFTDQIVKASAGKKHGVLASRIQDFLSSIQQYSSIIDTCAGPNQIAAALWGSIKFVLLVTSNVTEYFEKLSRRVAQLSIYCPRLLEYEKLFPTSIRVQEALSDFYAIVVVFCSKALKVVQNKGIRKFTKAAWKSFKLEFGEIEECLSAAKDEIKEELQLASEQARHDLNRLLITEIAENKAMRLQQVVDIQENKQFRSQQMRALEQSKERQIQKTINEKERQRIRLLERIRNHEYTRSFKQAQATRCEGTCRWIQEKPEFSDWYQLRDPKHLWCYGIPGCGKTILMGYVVEFLTRTFSAEEGTIVIYYFFDFSDKQSLRILTFLRCVLHQAIGPRTLLPDFQRRLESLFPDGTDYTEPTISELTEIFLHVCENFKTIFLLIDGLDEADKSTQRNTKSFLREMQKMDSVRILATTHPDVDMQKILIRSPTIQVKPEDADIQLFVKSQIDNHSQELSVCSTSLLDRIEEFLLRRAEGMFLWVALQFEGILEVCEEDESPSRVLDILESSPQKITELYTMSLTKLLDKNDEKTQLAKKVFQWTVSSRRPLTVDELEEAISIRTDQTSWESPSLKLDLSKLCKLCGNLVKVDKNNKTVLLAHHTVEDFLLSCSSIPRMMDFVIEEYQTQGYLAQICLTYLTFTDFHRAMVRTTDTKNVSALAQPLNLVTGIVPESKPLLGPLLTLRSRHRRTEKHIDLISNIRHELSAYQSTRTDPSFQLLGYCKSYWSDHSRYIEPQDKNDLALLTRFFGSPSPSEWKPWSSIANKESLPNWKMFLWAVRESQTAVFHIWQNIVGRQEIDYWKQIGSEDGPKLFLSACETDNLEQLQIMLGTAAGNGLLSRLSADEIASGLITASEMGHLAVVERLLEEKVDVNTTVANGHSGRKSAVNTAPKTRERDGRTALQAAAEGGHLAIVERLLQENADVNAAAAEYGSGRTALQAAAGGGHLAIVERLLQENADVNAAAAEYGSGRTALQAAAGGGHLAVVKRLLQENADVNAAAAKYEGRTALQAAAGGGHLAVVERLLQENADVNAAAAKYEDRTALQAAAGGGHLAVVERLLQEKADVNAAAGSWGRTALQAAAEGGHLAVVERLLQEKADVNAAAA